MVRQEKQTGLGNNTAILIGAKLRQAREEQKISLTEMAKRLNYTKSYLSGVENGKERASEVLIRRYERELGLKPGELSEAMRTLRTEQLNFTPVINLLTKSASSWLPSLRDTLLDKGKELAIEQPIKYGRGLLRLDEKEQVRHLEVALKNAIERGLAKFHTPEERDQYRDVLSILSEPGAHSETLRDEVLRLFTLSARTDFLVLNELYNRSHRIRSQIRSSPLVEINAAPYLKSFFDALIAELYSDPFFKQQMNHMLEVRADLNMQRSLTEVVTTLRQLADDSADEYNKERLGQDVEAYIAYLERTLHYLKLVGVVPRDRGNEQIDPELHDIFVPLKVTLEDKTIPVKELQGSIITLLEHYPYIVLLGGPGSGKSTLIRQLAWNHAVANQPDSPLSNVTTLSGNPLPLRIELRRLTEDRRRHPDYNFLSYATEVLLEREGIEINPQMFKELLERRAMLLLFDGLDEVATLDDRQRLVEEIEHFAQFYPGNRILIASRPVGYELARFSPRWFAQASIQNFDDQQIHMFLENWYTYVLRLSPLPQEDQYELEILYNTLKNNLRLRALAVNPLLLTIITALHRYERLPDRRILLYDRCADLLLETWAKLKGTNTRWQDLKLSKDDQYACVAHLGFMLHERSQIQVPERFLLREIEHFFRRHYLIAEVAMQRVEAMRFLELIKMEAGLIVEKGIDENGESLYGFVHIVFQEYFAAVDVYERYLEEEDPAVISAFLKEHLHDPYWHEVLLLLLGKLKRKPATVQLRQILEEQIRSNHSQYAEKKQQDFFFVCNCLTEEIVVESEFAKDITSHLGELVKYSENPLDGEEALNYLDMLVRTHLYGDLGQRELTELLLKNNISDVNIKIKIAQILFLKSKSYVGSKERQQAFQMLSNLAQSPDLSQEQASKIAAIFKQSSSEVFEEE